MSMMRVLFDLNVLLDVLLFRQLHYEASARVWELAETKKIEGLVAAHSFSTLYYLYSRQTSREFARNAIQRLLTVFTTAEVNQVVLVDALGLGWLDFEDAIQMAAAQQSGAEYVISRNPTDYKTPPLPVIQPAEFLPIFNTLGVKEYHRDDPSTSQPVNTATSTPLTQTPH
jgi:predicted nucleic acid-binding protein